MDIIHVGLYGGKGRPLVADVLYCDKYEQCSYYKDNKCLNVRSLNKSCKYGKVNSIRGYTSRAKKYYEFKNKWKEHEKYGRLKYPETKLGIIGDHVLIPYPFVIVEEKEDGEISVYNQAFSNAKSWIRMERLTPEIIKKIVDHKPYAMMGGEIKDFQEKYVPLFLAHLKEVLPGKYEEFINEHPKYQKEINYVGRKALLKTIDPSTVWYVSERYPNLNEEWYWNGEYLLFVDGRLNTASVTNDYDLLEFKILPSDKSVVKITNNNQVNKDTVFVD